MNDRVLLAIAVYVIGAVLGWACVGVIFALSGAVGPILGQNYGARLYDRLTETMRDSLIVTLVYCLTAWGLLALFAGQVADLFGALGEARELVIFFCLFAAGSFLFNGALFVANAAFNNLGFPGYGTVFSQNQHSRWFAHQVNAELPHPPKGALAGGPNSSIQDPVVQALFATSGCAPGRSFCRRWRPRQ